MAGIAYPPVLLKDRQRLVNFESSVGLKALKWLLFNMPTLVHAPDPKLLGNLTECYGHTVECQYWKSRAMAKVVASLPPERIGAARKNVRKILGSKAADEMDVFGIVYHWQAELVESGASVMKLPVSDYDGNLDAFMKETSIYFPIPSPADKLVTKDKWTKSEAIEFIVEDQLLLFKNVLIPGFRESYLSSKASALTIKTIQESSRIAALFKLTGYQIHHFHTFMDEGLAEDFWMQLNELILSVQTEIGWMELKNKVGVTANLKLQFQFNDGSIVNT